MPCRGWVIAGIRYSHDDILALAKARGHTHRIPLAGWQALWRGVQREGGYSVSPSAAGRCPRLRLLRATEDYWLDPETTWPLLRGTAYHSALETGDAGDELSLVMPLQVQVDGTRVEIPLRGRLDNYDVDSRRLVDYKNTEEFVGYNPETKKREAKRLPTTEHEAQVNLYRLMLEHHGKPVDEALIWYFSSTHKGGWPRKVVDVPLWDKADAHELALELAAPLARTQVTGVLPPCSCSYPGYGTDVDLCKAVADADWKGLDA